MSAWDDIKAGDVVVRVEHSYGGSEYSMVVVTRRTPTLIILQDGSRFDVRRARGDSIHNRNNGAWATSWTYIELATAANLDKVRKSAQHSAARMMHNEIVGAIKGQEWTTGKLQAICDLLGIDHKAITQVALQRAGLE